VAADPYAQSEVPPAGLVVDPTDLEDLGDVEVSDQDDHQIRAAIAQAERDLTPQTLTVHLTGEQLALLKRAVAACGIGVETYVKDAALHRAGAEPPGASNENGATQ